MTQPVYITEDSRNYRVVVDGTVIRRFMKKTWTKREVIAFRLGFIRGLNGK
ncbi:MAG TPA: hypothetical protein VH541_05475 [Gaiellaceae bacterium]